MPPDAYKIPVLVLKCASRSSTTYSYRPKTSNMLPANRHSIVARKSRSTAAEIHRSPIRHIISAVCRQFATADRHRPQSPISWFANFVRERQVYIRYLPACSSEMSFRYLLSLCVRPSRTKTAKRRITQTTPRDSRGTLSFLTPTVVSGWRSTPP